MTDQPRPKNAILPVPTRGRVFAAAACGAAALFVAAVAGTAAAGHGAVSYENPKKIEEQKKRQKEAATGQPAAPASQAPAAAAPAAAAPAPAGTVSASAGTQGGSRDHVFATTARRELSGLAAIAEEQVAGGTDPELAALARRTLESVRKQMAELDQWLAAHPEPPSAR